ncbi:MAG TPA: histidine phosphatase family protein [Roseiflexaceae bacterium]
MKTIKMLSPSALIIRGLFLSAIVLGGCTSRTHPSGATERLLQNTAPYPPTRSAADLARGGDLKGRALADALRHGGFVIYVRHAETDISHADTDLRHLQNCRTQRNLSNQGHLDAERIGDSFRALDIPVGQVLASPYCRTLDTARLAFGRATPTDDLISRSNAENDPARQKLVDALKQLLSSAPPDGTNTVLVSHNFNLQDATGVALAEGESAIFAPGGPDRFTLVARLLPRDWARLARMDALPGIEFKDDNQ